MQATEDHMHLQEMPKLKIPRLALSPSPPLPTALPVTLPRRSVPPGNSSASSMAETGSNPPRHPLRPFPPLKLLQESDQGIIIRSKRILFRDYLANEE